MDSSLAFIEQNWNSLLPPLGVMAAIFLLGLALRNSLFRLLRQWAAGKASKADRFVIDAVRGPFMIWVLMLGVHLGVQSSKLPPRVQNISAQILLILFTTSMTLVCSRLAGVFVRFYVGSMTTLAENLARLAVLLVGAIVILDKLGISVLPILTALGVGGLAIALALQDTLSNLFSGFYVSLAGQVRLGDYVKLDSGEEGYITDITWRSTSVRSLQNNTIIIPNAKLAKATITNYNLPEQSLNVSIGVSVSYSCDVDVVEKILMDEIQKAVGQVPGLLAKPEPSVRLAPGFGASSLDLTINCSVQKFVDQFLVQHEMRKRVFRRLREESIEIPFPTRTVYMHDASAKAEESKTASAL